MSLIWESADRKLLSVTNHDVQGIAGDLICRTFVSFLDVDGHGWIDIFTTLYLCTAIPSAILLGRTLIEDPATQRFGDSSNGVQRFGMRCSRYVRPSASPTLGKSEGVPVLALLDTLLPPDIKTIIPCTTGTVLGRATLKKYTRRIIR